MTRECQTCGGPLPPLVPYGHRRKFCSERCRKMQYDLECTDCGGRVNGWTPSKLAAEPRCVSCRHAYEKANAIWTRDAIVLAIQDWTEEYGVPPTATDWNCSLARARNHSDRVERWKREACWPSVHTVQRVWGSWSAAVTAAGFDAFTPGRYGREGEDPELCAEIRRRYEAGEGPHALAAEYGCSEGAISGRIVAAGGAIRSRSEAGLLRWAREKAAA